MGKGLGKPFLAAIFSCHFPHVSGMAAFRILGKYLTPALWPMFLTKVLPTGGAEAVWLVPNSLA